MIIELLLPILSLVVSGVSLVASIIVWRNACKISKEVEEIARDTAMHQDVLQRLGRARIIDVRKDIK